MELTQTTADVLLRAVQEAGLAGGRCLRLVRDDAGYKLTIGLPSGWDTVLEHEGRTILTMSKEVEKSLENAVIYVKEEDGAFQLLVYRPAS